MKSKQVLSVEQMKHLKELGLDTSDGSMCFEWNESDSDNMVATSPDADTNYTIIMKLTLCKILFTICLASSAIKC